MMHAGRNGCITVRPAGDADSANGVPFCHTNERRPPARAAEAEEGILSDEAARWILVRGARTLAHDDALVPSLEILLGVMVERLDIESAVVVVADGRSDQPVIIAASGLGEPARAGLNEALRNPSHPVVKALSESVATFDVLPSQPGGPALRSHLPLSVTRDGTARVLGVLALAHHRPLDAEARRLVEAAADLAAVDLERHRRT